MKTKNYKLAIHFLLVCLFTNFSINAQIGIGTTTPNPSSILDIQSTTQGVLMPRMTTIQRDAIVSPAEGLLIYNTTTKSTDVYSSSIWKSYCYSEASTNLIYVYSLADLPTPAGNNITLDATKMYIFSGFVNISPNYITMNGAGIKGTDPQKDIVASTISGAVLRSYDTNVFMENLSVIPMGGATKAYDFSDTTGTKFCNAFAGCSVIETSPSLGVGQISGFKAITMVQNYWKVTDGIKINGTIGKFTSSLCFIDGVTSGSGIEFLSGAVIDDIDLANNYFNYSGQTGVKVNAGAWVNRARMTNNMFRNVGVPLSGVDSYTSGWSMKQNTNIPDSRAFSFIYFNNNLTSTTLSSVGTYTKIAGTTTMINEKRFTTNANRITYDGVDPVVGKISVVMGAKAPGNNVDFSIGIAKNGILIAAPKASMAAASNNQAFQIILNTEVDLVIGDYIEVWITRNNTNASTLVVDELQFRVTD